MLQGGLRPPLRPCGGSAPGSSSSASLALRFEGPARPPLPCYLGCLKNTTLCARGCLIFVLWLYRMICYFNASRRAGAHLCALAGARRRARPPPLRLRQRQVSPPPVSSLRSAPLAVAMALPPTSLRRTRPPAFAVCLWVFYFCFVVAVPRTPPRPVSPPPVSSLRSAPLAVALALPPPEPGAWFATSLIVSCRV